uniref:Cathepsin L n=1 Tax=Fasciola hepatica TaxID=6192 RepID=A8W638_FASHE|nr:cathepsin L [Fasciola hepatica]
MRLLTLAVLFAGAFASNDVSWHEWKRMYNKEYNGADDEHRLNIWEQNVKHIEEHNLRHDRGLVTYKLGLNQFTDLTFEEFKAKYLMEMSPVSESLSDGISYEAEGNDVPASIDWRQYGYVTEVKDQGQCGSCWAFSAVGAIEGQYVKKFRNRMLFSEQQLVDCTKRFGNHGCSGGWMENAYRYLKDSGLETASYYPYQAWEYQCQYRRELGVAKVTGAYTVHSGDEMRLMQMVGREGPAAVAVDAQSDFYMYQSGIFQSQTCTSQRVTHAVLAVGYGTESGTDYWILKNSWGKWWGEDGYMRFARNRNNMCAIASVASVPMVERFP